MRLVSHICLCALACGLVHGQTGDSQPSFEAASVRPSTPLPVNAQPAERRAGCTGGPGTSDPGTWSCHRILLSELILRANALGAVDRDLLKAPGWMDEARFEITAKVPPGTTKDQFRAMLRALLEERFHLASHHEKQEAPVYALVIAKSGSKIKEAPDKPAAADNNPGPRSYPPDSDGYPVIPPTESATFANGHRWTMHAVGESMEQFARELKFRLDRPVVDETGLRGKYEILLRWINGPLSPDGPDLTEAIERQLGLKLQPKKAAIDVIVIDHADKAPTEQ
jgi:uncharacterized protein (TIGR03435 family)